MGDFRDDPVEQWQYQPELPPTKTDEPVNKTDQASNEATHAPRRRERKHSEAKRPTKKSKRRPLIPRPKSRLGRWGAELAFVAVAALALSFILKTFFIQSFFIPSESMEDTLAVDDRVVVSKLAPGPLRVHRGDIVVFRDPGDWLQAAPTYPERSGVAKWMHSAVQAVGLAPATDQLYLVKRVIGVAGDKVECVIEQSDKLGGTIHVNGAALDETYLKEGSSPCTEQMSVVIPDNSVWLMGDNRQHSADSRFHRLGETNGSVDLGDVVGVAKIRMWPLSRFSILSNPGDVFRDVPNPADVEQPPTEGG